MKIFSEILLIFSLILGSCGIKGPLYLPTEEPSAQRQIRLMRPDSIKSLNNTSFWRMFLYWILLKNIQRLLYLLKKMILAAIDSI